MEYERWSSSRGGAEDEQIPVIVSDTGIGFPPQMAEQIFHPFFTTKPHGTGMGLRISWSIIESHGGRLWAAGSPGSGATFHLNLFRTQTRLQQASSCIAPIRQHLFNSHNATQPFRALAILESTLTQHVSARSPMPYPIRRSP